MGFDSKRPPAGRPAGGPAAKRPAAAGGSAGPYHGGYAPGKGPPGRGAAAAADEEEEAAALAAAAAMDAVDVDGPPPPDDDIDDDDGGGGGFLEDVALELGEAGRNWERPAPRPLDCATQDLTFQQIEVDYFLAPPDQRLRPGCDLSEAPVVRMFGVDGDGASVAAFVHGFDPYFYVEAPPNFGPDDCDGLCRSLNARLAERVGSRGGGGGGAGPSSSSGSRQQQQQTRFCLSVTMEAKKSIMGYSPGGPKPFLRVALATPNLVAPARGIMESGLSLGAEGMGSRAFLTYESNVLYALRFMVDKGVVGGCWVTLPRGKYALGGGGGVGSGTLVGGGGGGGAAGGGGGGASAGSQGKATHCQIEAHIHARDLVAHAPEGEWARLAPLRVLSFDIECAGRKGHFPEPSKDPVIQIASMVTVQGQPHPTVKNILTLDTCAPIAGAEVMSFTSEKDLLRRWRDLVVESDPDVVIGYNTTNFDLPYLLDRASALGVGDFPFFGRVQRSRVRMRDTTFSSKAYGTRDMKEITIEGRVQLDLLTAIQREHKLSSYSLNAVSAHFLGEQKEDVHHSIISDLQAGTAETRRRLAVYCLKDAYLPQRLLDKLMLMYNHVEMARVTGVPMSYLLARGQSVKVFSQILRKARARGLVVPGKSGSRGAGGGGAGGGGGGPDSATYEGATVLEAKQGFYRTPVATLDFASLYPSIMMAHNLCYSTLLSREAAAKLPPSEVLRSPTGDAFAKKSLAVGILPEILEELLAARKRAKRDLKEATDPFVKAVLDGRQLALKISANSVYGFTGATVGVMPCLEISASVTAFGRDMIEHTRRLVEARYTRANGYGADAEVVYGDTDSVMVDFKVPDVARAMDLGREAAEHVSATFARPIKLEFEKVYNPYLLISKKRYAGLLWTDPAKWDKMDTKGIETVRRDNCALVRRVVGTCLDKLLIDRDVAGAAAYVKSTISDLLMNRLDLSLLVITKALSKAEYDVKTAHVELAKRMRARDAATAPNLGDRVAYVIVRAAKGAKAWEKAEDPVWALDHALPIDAQHYLEHHLAQPLLRIFEPLMRDPRAELLQGEHTRSIALSTPTAAAGGIMRFAKVKRTCLGCKAPLPDVAAAPKSSGKGENDENADAGVAGVAGDDCGSALCRHCAPRRAEIYSRALNTATALEDAFASLWTQCQRCQGSLHADVLCTSRDCPIFYRRKKVAKDLAEAGATLARFPDADAW